MRLNIIIGGKAGQGPNVLANILGDMIVKNGHYVFSSRDYGSIIRGGHNFNALTVLDEPVHSNDSKIDILVALDDKTEEIHKNSLNKNAVILKGSDRNMYYAGRLVKLLGMDFKFLEDELKKLRNFDENLKDAKKGYSDEKQNKIKLHNKKGSNSFATGTQGVAEGALKSGLDVYYAYPMTPATPLMFELAPKQLENNIMVLELENEIAVIKAAIGSAITGAKSMCGTSGGGFDLMAEALSEAGIIESPLVIYLAQRPGPSTGVPTYTGQGDLNAARHSGHGEFPRLVVAPGDPIESAELTSQCFYFSQKFKMPCIIMTDKHLAESFYTTQGKPKLAKSEKTTMLKRYNSYEHDEKGEVVETSEDIKKAVERRLEKAEKIMEEAEKFEMFKIHGKKDSKNIIVSWGSTKGAILDAIKGRDAKFLQILYIEPFSKKIKAELEKAENVIVVENNATAPLASLIKDKTCVFVEDKNKILRYDGRPFFHDELKEEIERRLG